MEKVGDGGRKRNGDKYWKYGPGLREEQALVGK